MRRKRPHNGLKILRRMRYVILVMRHGDNYVKH